MTVSISDIPKNKTFSDYSDKTNFILEETQPRYILEPFEIISPADSRYEDALTREQLLKINDK